MLTRLGTVTYLVRDYDEALAYFVDVLGFTCREDTPLSPLKRWVIVSPDQQAGAALLLAKAKNATEAAAIGNQAGGRVFLFLYTNDFQAEHARLTRRGVQFRESPRHESYGTVAVFADLYGNLWDLIELKSEP